MNHDDISEVLLVNCVFIILCDHWYIWKILYAFGWHFERGSWLYVIPQLSLRRRMILSTKYSQISAGIVTTLEAGCLKNHQLQAETRDFSLLQGIHTSCMSHWASYPLDNGGSFPEGKVAGCETNQSLPSSIGVKNAWSYPTIPPYIFMVWWSGPSTGHLEELKVERN
jgi:hypothetical protein